MSESPILTSDNLDQALEEALIGSPMPSGRRFLGIEVERLILHKQTREAAPLPFCRQLIADLATAVDGKAHYDGEVLTLVEGDGIAFTMEPGGQLELATSPRRSLGEIDPTMQRIRELVRSYLKDTDYELSTLGHTPQTLPEDIGLLPRARYQIMDREMIKRGSLSRNMMRATAGFQVTYDVSDREDAGRKLSLLNRLAPLMVAITANSRMVGGADSGYASFRHKVWLETDHDRSGVPEGGLHAETAIDGYKRFARRATTLFLKRDGEFVASPQKSFEDLVASGGMNRADLDLHLTSLFPVVRLRNYLEVRYLDAVPWDLARSVLALLSGLVYCPLATQKAEALSQSLVPENGDDLRVLHESAARDALDARASDGRQLRDLARELVGFSRATLGGEDCCWSVPEDLAVVAERIG